MTFNYSQHLWNNTNIPIVDHRNKINWEYLSISYTFLFFILWRILSLFLVQIMPRFADSANPWFVYLDAQVALSHKLILKP